MQVLCQCCHGSTWHNQDIVNIVINGQFLDRLVVGGGRFFKMPFSAITSHQQNLQQIFGFSTSLDVGSILSKTGTQGTPKDMVSAFIRYERFWDILSLNYEVCFTEENLEIVFLSLVTYL